MNIKKVIDSPRHVFLLSVLYGSYTTILPIPVLIVLCILTTYYNIQYINSYKFLNWYAYTLTASGMVLGILLVTHFIPIMAWPMCLAGLYSVWILESVDKEMSIYE